MTVVDREQNIVYNIGIKRKAVQTDHMKNSI